MIDDLLRLRVAVGLLGEKDHSNWWQSNFLSKNGQDFLRHVFGEGTRIAQYNGVLAAGQRRHDDAVGQGARVYHLFRLPEALEQGLTAELVGTSAGVLDEIASADAARQLLAAIAAKNIEPKQGAVLVGTPQDLSGRAWVRIAAAHYLGAFVAETQSFPYVAELKS